MPKNPRVPVDVVAKTAKFDAAVKSSAKAATATFAAFGAAGAAAVLGITKATLDLSVQLNKLAKDARKVGASVEDIQRVQGAFELLTGAGVDAGRFIQDFQRNLEEAKDGAGPAKDAFDKLGISLGEIADLPLTEKLAFIGDAIGDLDTQSAKTQVTLDLFGRSGRAAIEAFGNGGGDFREAMLAIEEAGLISAKAAFQAEELQDAVLIAGKRLTALRVDALSPLMPVITGTIDALSSLGSELRETGAVEDFGNTVANTFIEVVLPAVTVGAAQSVKALRGLATTFALLDVGLSGVKISLLGYQSILDLVTNGGKLSQEQWQRNKAAADDLAAAQIRLDLATAGFAGTEEEAAAVMDRVIASVRDAQAAYDGLATSKDLSLIHI
jgi:hypothetical protein